MMYDLKEKRIATSQIPLENKTMEFSDKQEVIEVRY